MRRDLLPSTTYREKQSPGRRRVCILGSTGSIGESALKVIAQHPDQFEVYALAARGNARLLLEQARKFKPRYAVLKEEGSLSLLKEALAGSETTVLSGRQALADAASAPEVDVVLAAVVGMAGLPPILAALEAGKRVALANKESLVAAGDLVKRVQARSGSTIIPVDSEHSAIYQALQGVSSDELSELILTASGGPFLHVPRVELGKITVEQALNHPRWKMGAKISVDSATLVNKALEVIEAHFLFGVAVQKIKVLVHPQSIVHSLIALIDGTLLAQLSVPDMCGPIAYALCHPGPRLKDIMAPLQLSAIHKLEFLELDEERFCAVRLARQALCSGGVLPAVFNCANEAAVSLFMQGKLPFAKITDVIEEELGNWSALPYATLEELLSVEEKVQASVASFVNQNY